jgi:hypothetical protein
MGILMVGMALMKERYMQQWAQTMLTAYFFISFYSSKLKASGRRRLFLDRACECMREGEKPTDDVMRHARACGYSEDEKNEAAVVR